MAAAIADIPVLVEPARAKKSKSRKALAQKISSSSDANILAGTISEPSPIVLSVPENQEMKENHESLSQPRPPQQKKSSKRALSKSKNPAVEEESNNFDKELKEMKEKFEQMRLEKEQTEELLKAKDEVLKQTEEEKQKLHIKLKKMQKIKEFNPTLNFPIGQSSKENEKKGKKKGELTMKRPSPAYVLWCKDQWVEVKKANPEAEFKNISNLLGAKWKTISLEEKKPYEERYQAEKEVYLKYIGNEKREHEAMKLLEEEKKQKTAMELFEQYMLFKQETETEKENKKTKKEKDPLKPKHPMSAFFLFSNERRPNLLVENKNMPEVAKLLGEEWKSMTEEQKAPFEEMAKKNKEEYATKMEAYKQKKDEEVTSLKKEEEEFLKLQKQEALQLLKKKEKTEKLIKKTKENRPKKKEVDPNKPKKPASSFLLFSKEARKTISEERPGINNSTLIAIISVKWKELSETEKQVWNGKAAGAMDAYKKELEEYNKNVAEKI